MALIPSLIHDYWWNEATERYIDRTTGHFVPNTALYRELDTIASKAAGEIETITQSMIDGNTSIEEWQLAMEREIKILHTTAGAASRGGWAQMSQSDWGFVGSQCKKQYDWLRDFAVDIQAGRTKGGRILQRAKLYAESGRSTFEAMRRRMATNKGKTEGRRRLGPVKTEHCRTDGDLTGCVELAALGWMPIEDLTPIGESPCYTHCHCFYEFR